VEKQIKRATGDARVVKQSEKLFHLATGAFISSVISQSNHLTNSFIGVSVTLLPNLNLSVYPHLIHAETRVLVDGKVAVDTCVLSNVILDHVHRVKLPPVWNVTAQRRRFSLSVVALM